MKLALAQMNSTVGDFSGNLQRMISFLDRVRDVDMVLFPETALCGYPAQDLLDYRDFALLAEKTAADFVAQVQAIPVAFGSVALNRGSGKPLLNVLKVAHEGRQIYEYSKRLLPTYDVFDEDRFFEAGRSSGFFEWKGTKIGFSVCEDIWSDDSSTELHQRYQVFPLEDCKGVDIFLNISASPFETKKVSAKRQMLQKIAQRYRTPLVYVNCVGANDSLIFDGRSYAWSGSGDLLLEGPAFEEALLVVDVKAAEIQEPKAIHAERLTYDALVLGIRDYCHKSGFRQAILGLSGGMDSSLVACLATDALGIENVHGVLMPSRFTSVESNRDALLLAKALQNPTHILSIEDLFQSALHTLEKSFEGFEPDITEENIQARTRGLLLMALANKYKALVLTTGNKSELAVGYCTLYGDMCGALAPIADIYKTEVYALAREANRRAPRIPETVFTKAPSAELRHNQTDQDTLPPYEVLDTILYQLIEQRRRVDDLLREGVPHDILTKVMRWLGASEYKRFQMPLGLKVSQKAFGMGRRMPVVQRFFTS